LILQKVLHFFHEKLVNKLNQFAAIGFSEVATSQFDLRGNGHSGIKVSQIMKKNFFLALTLVMLVAACLTSGYFYGKLTKVESAETTTDSQLQPSKFEQLMLKAESATGGKKMAMATASIDGDVDVLFTLDYESGILYAWLPGPGKEFLGEWTVRVDTALGLDKGGSPDLVMTVGSFNANEAARGSTKPAPLIVYVGNGDNGRVVGYRFFWDRQVFRKAQIQRDVLIPIFGGTTRQATVERQ